MKMPHVITGRLEMLRELQQDALAGKSDEELSKKFDMPVWKIMNYRSMVGVYRKIQSANIFRGEEKALEWYNEANNPQIRISLPLEEDFGLKFSQKYVVVGKKISNRKIELTILEAGKK